MSDAGAWDFALQRDQTAFTVNDLIQRTDLNGGERIVLDLEFIPGPDADKPALVRKFAMFRYTATDGDDGALRIEVPDVTFDADAIWEHEERTTKLALLHGFQPDGWGFWEP
ncbi:hypothetical protein [Oceanibium sediminis]|uniref:hypothetical protein n=1 Tax=Oceanibium sediminis TaxID=2026339 RepID=UPI000DD48A97|nr:hypothetical protein [Oceanibium sediminis]